MSTPLTGGVTNLNYKIDADGKSYVLRICGQDTDKLGIRRDVEYCANLAAGQLGIAPEVLYCIEPEGYLVTRFIKARRLPPESLRGRRTWCAWPENCDCSTAGGRSWPANSMSSGGSRC